MSISALHYYLMLRHLAAKAKSGLKGGHVIISFVLVFRFIDDGTPSCVWEAIFVDNSKFRDSK